VSFAFCEGDERRTDLDKIAVAAEQLLDLSARGRRHFDHRLVGLD
jgi:hypothetical protein